MGTRMGPAPVLFVERGQRFGRGVVIDPDVRLAPAGGARTGARAALLRCDCGAEYTPALTNLLSKTKPTMSCIDCAREAALPRLACHRRHGLSSHPLYMTWCGMLRRCEDARAQGYENYGGRGIKVCERWHDVALFVVDIELLLGPRPPGMTLNRIDNDGNYEPGNVEWADTRSQIANRRSVRLLARRLAAAVALLDEHGLADEYRKRVA